MDVPNPILHPYRQFSNTARQRGSRLRTFHKYQTIQQAEKQALNESPTLLIDYKTSSDDVKNLLKTDGELPDAGEFEIDENGKVKLALWSDSAHICVVKGASSKEIVINENINDADSCTIANMNKD